MKNRIIIGLIMLCWIATGFKVLPNSVFINKTTPPPPEKSDIESEIVEAIQMAISRQEELAPAFQLFQTQIDHIKISKDLQRATAWLTPIDLTTGQLVATEPGLALAHKVENQWQITLPNESQWTLALVTTPSDLMTLEEKTTWLEFDQRQKEIIQTLAVYGGYYLPWEGGAPLYLTQSTAHDRYTPSGNAHYSFDFATTYPSSLFSVHAAKAGTVKYAVWSHENGNESFANYIVLEDTTTSPTTYQLYLHLAKDSIPPALRVIGAQVAGGQLIGIADDTGVSTGNHLHFMVHTNPASYWGKSVDITFQDVLINGGRPRIPSDLPYCYPTDVCDQTQYSYTSGNYLNPDHTPPFGSISVPFLGDTINNKTIRLEGWANDAESGLSSAQFIAKFNGIWHPIGNPHTTNTFSYDWNVCDDEVPDGELSLALDIRDKVFNQAVNLPGLTHVIKNFSCPTIPNCIPSSNEIALFANPDFKGACATLPVGTHTSPGSWGNLGNDNTDSIIVGTNVQATLYSESDLQRRGETFLANDSNLLDNRIGANTTSSVLVQLRTTTPATPSLTWPNNSISYPSNASLSLTWDNMGGATSYQARIQTPTQTITSPWQSEAFWNTSFNAQGTYNWQVRSRNSTSQSNWSALRTFKIQTPVYLPLALNVPYTDTMETTSSWWTSVYWKQTTEENHTKGGANSWKYNPNSTNGYDTGTPNQGYLTSPPFQIPPDSEYYLRFWYLYETESPGKNWDQRWIQISTDGGPFTNVVQLSNDVPNIWLQSPSISLLAYAGRTIQVRFFFTTLDQTFNSYKGWYIDDLTINSNAPPTCNDTDNDPSQATFISYGSTTQGTICPGGDLDYFKFQANSGDQIGIAIDAQAIDSKLDPYIFLLDQDGQSILVENDDRIYEQLRDAFLSYRIQRSGTYFIRLKAWDHPSVGGINYHYNLRLVNDSSDPVARFIKPITGQQVPVGQLTLNINANDTISGISHVKLFRHSEDWQNGDWEEIGDDWNTSDGWEFITTITAPPQPPGIAFFAQVYDWAGNWIGTGVWNLVATKQFFPIIRK